MSSSLPTPLPLFDTLENINKLAVPANITYSFATQDFKMAQAFLKQYDGSLATFNSYRREVERLIQWAWLVEGKSVIELKREDIENYLKFCKAPPKTWIGLTKVPRFIDAEGLHQANPEWRPFVATVTKSAAKKGVIPDVQNYELSDKALRSIFAILSSFYNFLIQEDCTPINPLLQLRQKSKFFRKRQGQAPIRRLSELQWASVLEITQQMADSDPSHERSLFIITALFAMYLRISELTASKRWLPKMCDFHRDSDGNWWFITVGKGNKERQIAVSDAMLNALKRWRTYLGLSALPSASDTSPLVPKLRGNEPISSTNQIRNIVQYCFDQTIAKLEQDGFKDEAESLQAATVHWLRHTGISEDVKIRPREHVRDDAGHSSSATTDRYIDVELRARHASARKKPVV